VSNVKVEYLSRKALLEELAGYVVDSSDAGLFMCVSEVHAERSKNILSELDKRAKHLPFTKYEKDLEELDRLQDGMTNLAKRHFYDLANEGIEWLL
jgi:hypothetical protein